MSYDLYIDQPQGDEATQLRLLITKDNPLPSYLKLIHGTFDKKSKQRTPGTFDQFIDHQQKQLHNLGINPPQPPELTLLPAGSWFLQFEFTLARPWMSKDDDPFYVAESVNPVRKDKVFKVPMMSAASWKGLLRWTAMHTRLVIASPEGAKQSPENFARERFRQTLLFGDEKGEEPGKTKDLAAYLDALKPEARAEYERLLQKHFGVEPDQPLPHHSGRLLFYPTFFNQIDVEVINPHSRETKAGTHPIYLESVPAGATGTFSLLYVPFDLIGQDEAEIRQQAIADLQLVAEAVKEMMLTYGFSAKRTSGYGVAKEALKAGFFQMRIAEAPAPPVATPAPAEPPLPKYLQAPGKLKDEYLNPDGTFRERSDAELKAMKKADRQEYEKARKWWQREGKTLAQQPAAQPEAQAPAEPPQPAWLTREFDSFAQLMEEVSKLAEAAHE
jgi:CRISPR-associated protein Cmr2